MTPVAAGRAARAHPRTDPDGARGHPALDGPRHGRRGAAALPGHQVTIGPAIEDGFYYDFDRPTVRSPTRTSRRSRRRCTRSSRRTPRSAAKSSTRDEALALFEKMGEKYKVEIIRAIPEGEELTLYRHGEPASDWVDLCHGPHVPTTGQLARDQAHQRRRRVLARRRAQPDAPAHLRHRVPVARRRSTSTCSCSKRRKKRDHRKLGKELDLFIVPRVSRRRCRSSCRAARSSTTGSSTTCATLYVATATKRCITPQIFDAKLFETSGHLGNYNENMYRRCTEDRRGADDRRRRDEAARQLRFA